MQLDELSTTCELGVKPVNGGVSDSDGGEFTEEDGVRDPIKGCTQVKEYENGE